MRVNNQANVQQLQPNQNVQQNGGAGTFRGLAVKIGQTLGKAGDAIANFFKNTLPNFFKSLGERAAATSQPQGSRYDALLSSRDLNGIMDNARFQENRLQGLDDLASPPLHNHQTDDETAIDLNEAQRNFVQFNDEHLRREMNHHIAMGGFDEPIDEEVVIRRPPSSPQQTENKVTGQQPQVSSSSDPFADLEQFLMDDIGQDKEKLKEQEKVADGVLRNLELSEKQNVSVSVSPSEMDRFISNAAKQIHGGGSFSEEDVNQLIDDLGGPLTNDERIEQAAQNIAGKQDFSMDDLEQLMQDLDEPKVTPQQQTPTVETKVLEHTTFLPRPVGNPFEKNK